MTADEKHQLIFDAILRERSYQDRKWGSVDSHPHSIFEWIGIMEQELSEAKAAFFQCPADSEMLKEILQVVAVGVACLEQHGVQERPQTQLWPMGRGVRGGADLRLATKGASK